MGKAAAPVPAEPPFKWAAFTARPTSAQAAYLHREFRDALERGDAYLASEAGRCGSDIRTLREVFYAALEMRGMMVLNPETLIELLGFATWIEEQMDRCLEFLIG